MAEVTVSIGGRNYPIRCDDGQEERVRALAARINAEAKAFEGAAISEARLLMMSALMIADKLDEAETAAAAAPPPAEPAPAPVAEKDLFGASDADQKETAAAIEAATARIAALAQPIAQVAPDAKDDDEGGDDGGGNDGDGDPEPDDASPDGPSDEDDEEAARARMRVLRRERRQARREQAEQAAQTD